MKLREFQAELAQKHIDLALFFSLDGDNLDPNLVYFTQYTGFGALAVTPKKAFLIVPIAEVVRAKRTSIVKVVGAKERLLKRLTELLNRKPRRIGVDKSRMSVNFYKKLIHDLPGKYRDVSGICLTLRTTKTPKEIQIIREACKITDEIMQDMLWNFKKFKTESDVAAHLIYETNKLGLGVSFKPIVASGKNACEAHHEPQNIHLNNGFCVIDFGIKYKGYCSDMTRTVYIGTPTQQEIEMYYTVLNVQMTLIGQCKPNTSFITIHENAHKLFGKCSPYFTHLIGHGVGTEIHENPNPKKTPRRPVTILLPGSIITIEPGLYYPHKSGIRIEDDILITKDGHEVLTKTGKNLLIIKK